MNIVTGFITNLWQHDPLLVIALGFILVLLVYLEIMRLRIRLLANTLSVVGEVFNSNRSSGSDGSGCVTNLLMLVLIIGFLFGIFAVLFM